jgi:hypothetical protein
MWRRDDQFVLLDSGLRRGRWTSGRARACFHAAAVTGLNGKMPMPSTAWCRTSWSTGMMFIIVGISVALGATHFTFGDAHPSAMPLPSGCEVQGFGQHG